MDFFFQAEDLGYFINSVVDNDEKLNRMMSELKDSVLDHIFAQMVGSANFRLHHVPKNYDPDLESFT